MSEKAMVRLERWCETGFKRVGFTQTDNGTVFVAKKDAINNGIIDPYTVLVLWACRDFAQINEVRTCSNLDMMKISTKAAENFFAHKDF